ncbi:hypothetical protein F8O04_08285 [Pseudoclavibacter endophyticus]|uniref:Uncharacterized protein n=1 Tax=Pseudoclavibacter endophyticus TaxID=1778590 RepID=A0A6H9WGZ3_9MICO|nr:hypothetical protein F8O04_08285 [Pseudoclavibacter endophyticus]
MRRVARASGGRARGRRVARGDESRAVRDPRDRGRGDPAGRSRRRRGGRAGRAALLIAGACRARLHASGVRVGDRVGATVHPGVAADGQGVSGGRVGYHA